MLYYYASLLFPLSGEQIFGWRMLLTVPVMTLLILLWGEWHQVTAIARRMRNERGLWLVLPLSSALLGVQLWLFMWAPLHDKALDVSLGYFMLPLTMLLTGWIVHRDRLSRVQQLAALSAALGVAHGIYQAGGFSWAALLVAVGFPCYFVLRRRFETDRIGGLWFDLLLTLPVAYWFAIVANDGMEAVFADRPVLYLLIPMLGLISSLALGAYVLSSRYLNLSLFGLLGYVEPVLLVAVALLLGERIGDEQWMTYVPIWFAVGLLATEGVLTLRRRAGRGQ
jgi:chloramphenicol-sensitive protein RarD